MIIHLNNKNLFHFILFKKINIIKRDTHTLKKKFHLYDEDLKKSFEKISKGVPPRANINKIIDFLLHSEILSCNWTKLEIIDEIYKRKIDKTLSFHLNVLYGLGSKGIHLNKKGIISPILFLPLLDYDQFKYMVEVMKVADKEKKFMVHKQNEFINNFFKK
ncbi:conserved Plasmodium protein, unknown function [Plasmodium gallinaceum]|uniref:Uncharacterized protein n=1 Tax=Plasmodium gallinaceum TaxID=5849 RepID=A0A1J1H047_PLAGA|nr:conserved Plasmodium protein, unknown function [Plasmodium gallinaceum]CRG98113.1 conserved Plasmodium protein, unknown function [Plasmodium gallinaceum]